MAIGLAMAIAGWLDIALAWVPPRFGSREWEFATISRTFDGMALGSLGLSLFGVGLVLRQYRRLLALTAVLTGALTLVLLALAGLYLLNVPVAFQSAEDQILLLLKVAVGRTSTFILVYLGLYGWLTWFFWRHSRGARAAG